MTNPSFSTFRYNDGGRAAAGYKGEAGDCVTRAIAIATGQPYQDVYETLAHHLERYAILHRDRTAKDIARGGGRRGTTPRNGISPKIYWPYLKELGWTWTPTMRIGSGCKMQNCQAGASLSTSASTLLPYSTA